jgi:catechol 2,3-dioxygenase-like lactoylglutathione lyase family enzyme
MTILEQDGHNAIVLQNLWLAENRLKNHNAPLKIEHFALQVPDPIAMADWYVKHLGFTIARAGGEPSHARFLADSTRSVMLEIYRNPAASVPDYGHADPLLMHVAYSSDNPAADSDRLVQAGAVVVDGLMTTPSGDEIVMLRDPWGVPIQLVKRAKPML